MRKDPEKNSRIKRLAAGIMVLLSVSVTLVSVSYSWIRRQWTPSVSGQNLRIEASGALAFKLDGNVTNTVTLTDGLGSGFVLRPVSNSSGKSEDFFSLDRSDNDEFKYAYEHITRDPNSTNWKSAASKYGYIETSFYILYGDGSDSSTSGSSDGRVKFVYLDTAELKNSMENTLNAAQAARVSVSVEKASKDVTYIFGNAENDNAFAITDEKEGDTWIADGVRYYVPGSDYVVSREVSEGVSLYKDVRVEDMKSYNGGFTSLDGMEGTYVDPSRCLFEMQSRTANKKVTVRVWLEGCDPICSDDIAGLQLDLLMSFAAADCSAVPVKAGEKEYYRVIEQGSGQ